MTFLIKDIHTYKTSLNMLKNCYSCHVSGCASVISCFILKLFPLLLYISSYWVIFPTVFLEVLTCSPSPSLASFPFFQCLQLFTFIPLTCVAPPVSICVAPPVSTCVAPPVSTCTASPPQLCLVFVSSSCALLCVFLLCSSCFYLVVLCSS